MLITFRVLVLKSAKSFLKKDQCQSTTVTKPLATADLDGMDSSGINSVHWISNACSAKV